MIQVIKKSLTLLCKNAFDSLDFIEKKNNLNKKR